MRHESVRNHLHLDGWSLFLMSSSQAQRESVEAGMCDAWSQCLGEALAADGRQRDDEAAADATVAASTGATSVGDLYRAVEVAYYHNNLHEFLNSVQARVHVPRIWRCSTRCASWAASPRTNTPLLWWCGAAAASKTSILHAWRRPHTPSGWSSTAARGRRVRAAPWLPSWRWRWARSRGLTRCAAQTLASQKCWCRGSCSAAPGGFASDRGFFGQAACARLCMFATRVSRGQCERDLVNHPSANDLNHPLPPAP
ncbi:unnamed protein product [Prorocentrum cordatum]|uniref:Phospholipase B-like n=1 Tax=Prorocentrum cordatum TaxID=2364126 RepID=A0ABN9W1Y8_9DINO|nr:unnamed protein product [Polarella glacialis]